VCVCVCVCVCVRVRVRVQCIVVVVDVVTGAGGLHAKIQRMSERSVLLLSMV
jgi:hypothetical protein